MKTVAAKKKTKSKKKESKSSSKTSSKSKSSKSSESKASMEKTGLIRTKKFWILVAVLIIAGLAYLFRGTYLAAMVDGTPISRLEVIRELESQGGQQTLDQLVSQKLIEQEAEEQGISVSGQEVQEQIDQIRTGLEQQGQDFDQLLGLQGMTLEDLENNIERQLTIERLVEDRFEVSEEEVQNFLDQNEAQLPEDLSAEELEELARDQVSQTKMQQEIQKYLTELKESANIQYFVNY